MKVLKFLHKKGITEKTNIYFGIIGFLLVLWSLYFLFIHDGFYKGFIIGSSGTMFVCTSVYNVINTKFKKNNSITPLRFIITLHSGASLLFLTWAIFHFCIQDVFSGITLLIITLFLASIAFLNKKYGNEDVISKYFK